MPRIYITMYRLIKVTIELHDRSKINLEVDPGEEMKYIKEKIQHKTGFLARHYTLMFNGVQLDDVWRLCGSVCPS